MIIKIGKAKFIIKEIFKDTDTTQQKENDPSKLGPFENIPPQAEPPADHQNSQNSEDNSDDINDPNNIHIITEEHPIQEDKKEDPKIIEENKKLDTKDVIMCRICQAEDNTIENPLVSPCKCAGSIKYIHVQCMRAWFKSKLISRVIRNTTSYSIKGLECELCKQKFSMNIDHNGKIIDLIDIFRPKSGAYIVLESLLEKSITHIHITAMENKRSIRIGRGRDSDISISDNTVSRCHATIKYIDGEYFFKKFIKIKYYLNDNIFFNKETPITATKKI